MTDYQTGALWSSTLPSGQRSYYEQLLLETLRTKSILVPYCAVKEDFAARDTGVIIYSEVFDTSPNWESLSERGIWLSGAYLDSRSVQIQLEIHGDVIKLSDYNELVNFWANGDFRGLCRGKLGQNMVDYLDILARNAFLSVDTNYQYMAGSGNSDIYDLEQTDLFDPDYGELARIHLEEREIPGVADPEDGGSETIVCVTTPRVCHDIRNGAGSKWLEVQEYAGAVRKFNNEVGMWGGVRYVKTMRNKLFNYGLVGTQTTLSSATVVGQGAAATVDTVYTVGQTGATPYVTVADETGLAVGEMVTIHSATNCGDDGSGGDPPIAGDGTQEVRRIVAIDAGNNRVSFDKPLLKVHASGDYVTKGVDVHASFFMGGPSVVYGVGERPHPFNPPKIDDLGMVNRFAWRGFLKFQMFRPEYLEVWLSGGSTN